MVKEYARVKLERELDKLDMLWATRKITKKQWERHQYLTDLLNSTREVKP